MLLFYRLEAEDEDQGIESLEKELADVSWSDRNLVQCFCPEVYYGVTFSTLSVNEILLK